MISYAILTFKSSSLALIPLGLGLTLLSTAAFSLTSAVYGEFSNLGAF